MTMIQFFKDFDWSKIKIDFTKILGRCYYFNCALIWWLIDLCVFTILGISYKTLIFAIPLGIFTFIATTHWIQTLIYFVLCKNTFIKLDDLYDRSNALQGVPGCGKTSTINESGYLFALKQWKILQHEYWQIMSKPYDLLPTKLKNKYSEIIKAYNFYKKHEDKYIPCFHSFISIFVNGRKSHSLTKGCLLQVSPLPYRSVWVCDEISSLFPNSVKGDVKEQNCKLAELCRWIRHFTDSYAFFADIRFGDAFLAIRSGCGCILTLTKKQKWVLKPTFLLAIRNFIYSVVDFDFWLLQRIKPRSSTFNKIMARLKKSSSKYGAFVKWLNRLISCVGYREYYYLKSGSQEQSDEGIKTTKGRYYFKSCLDITYNDRAFKNLYSCKDLDFLEPDDSGLEMSADELNKMLGRTN